MPPNYTDMAAVFQALAHPTRLHILHLLSAGECCVCEIEAALDKRQAYISQQLMVLRDSGLVETRKDGLRVFYRLTQPRLSNLLEAAFGSESIGQGIPPFSQ